MVVVRERDAKSSLTRAPRRQRLRGAAALLLKGAQMTSSSTERLRREIPDVVPADATVVCVPFKPLGVPIEIL